jgi:hypothetical protein
MSTRQRSFLTGPQHERRFRHSLRLRRVFDFGP